MKQGNSSSPKRATDDRVASSPSTSWYRLEALRQQKPTPAFRRLRFLRLLATLSSEIRLRGRISLIFVVPLIE